MSQAINPGHIAYHLLIDLWDVPAGRRYMLAKVGAVKVLLDTIRRQVEMETLAEPIVLYAQGQGKHWGPGVTAIVPLTDSHMSSHALEELGWVHYDLFSCQSFDWEAVQKRLQQAYRGHGRAVLLKRHNRTDSPAEMVAWAKEW